MTTGPNDPGVMEPYHCGTRTAMKLKAGMIFPGALNAARDAGYLIDPDCRAFIAGYLDVVYALFPGGVIVDREGKLIDRANLDNP
jgi:hypothetical protein